MSSRRREKERADAALGHDATPRRDGGWDHHAACSCGAGALFVRRAATMRALPQPKETRG